MVGKLTSNKKASCSILSAIMGLNTYKTQNEQLLETRAHIAGNAIIWDGNEWTRWGDRLEPIILIEGCKRLGIDPQLGIEAPVKHLTLPLEGSLDGLADGKYLTIHNDPESGIYVVGQNKIVLEGEGVIESKATRTRPEDFPAMQRGPIQIQGLMMCGQYKWSALMVLYGGIELRIWLFPIHPGTVKSITEAVFDFDRRINAPEPEYYDLANRADAALVYPLGNEQEPKKLSADYEPLVREYHLVNEGLKDGEKAKDLLACEIQKQMGNHTKARVGRYEILWPLKNYKSQPEKIVAAKEARSVRQKTINIKEIKNG